MSDLDERILRLAKRLLEMTNEGSIQWERGSSSRDDVFAWSSPRSTVTIWSRDKDKSHPFVLAITDASGTEVERVTDIGDGPSYMSLWEIMDDLYPLVRRQALQVDKVINDLLEDLG